VLGVCDFLQIDIQHFVDEVKNFSWVEHRLEYVWLYNNIHRYNDAIASTPESTIAALQTLPWTQTLFLWWKDGGYSFEKLIQSIDKANITNIVLYPETGAVLLPLLANKYNCYLAKDFEEGIDRANNNTTTNQIALLSCWAAYTLGIPFEEKWTRFKQHIKTLEEKVEKFAS
jgi:UDP-N-acetylmuramoylalanine--D-glutamate ligase